MKVDVFRLFCGSLFGLEWGWKGLGFLTGFSIREPAGRDRVDLFRFLGWVWIHIPDLKKR